MGFSRNFQGIFLWVFQDDWNKKTNRSTNKQTNKQTNKHFLDPKYLSKIKWNLHKIFRGTFCLCPTKIKTKKTNKSINKQTNRQTNKHFRTYISQPNQVWSSWNCEGIWWGPFGYQMGARRAPIWWPKATSPPQELEVWPP